MQVHLTQSVMYLQSGLYVYLFIYSFKRIAILSDNPAWSIKHFVQH